MITEKPKCAFCGDDVSETADLILIETKIGWKWSHGICWPSLKKNLSVISWMYWEAPK